jgi:TonB family protein
MKTPRTTNLMLAAAALALLACALPPRAAAQRPDAQKSADEKFERGRLLLEQGDAAGAVPLLRDAAELRKKDADAWYYYGAALARARRAKDARKAFEKALKLRPDDAGARTGLAYSLLLLGKPRDAEREALAALKLEPQNDAARRAVAESHYVIGVIRLREERAAEAAAEAETALRSAPDFPEAALLAADALLDIYADESMRQAEKYPLTPASGEGERKAAAEKREPALAPVKARMREVAERLEAFVKSQPNNPAAEEWREQAATLRFYSRAGDENAGVFNPSGLKVRAVITFKPEPGFTEEARQHGTTGVVRLRAVLAADGHVRNILAIRRLPDGLTQESVKAARKIRFTPATVNGQPVSQFVVLEYNFNIY